MAMLLRKLSAGAKAVAPEELLASLSKHCPIVAEQPGAQQDAQEASAWHLH